MRLTRRIALVFGAGSSGPGWGNGKAAAVAYAREGAKVVAVDVSGEAAEETAGIIAEEGGEALAVAADVTSLASVQAAVDAALARFGRVDILHNNVGVVVHGGPVELDEEAFRRNLDINVGSVFRTAKAVLPHFLRQGSGVVVNISSLAAVRWTGYPYFAYYAAKAAVNQATVALALQYARNGIRANAVMPGMIDTPLIYKQISSQYASTDAMVAARNAMVPMGRMGTAWDVAAAAVFLASDEAKFITGVCLPVDGGQSCGMGT
ncbi:SDR family NAD(P)-dependent oxidoreductase [Prosthecomicrobium sp. N25]|uniref:SDR family NAD(P)-dependent oxidoreductase n=1 Tax=Prosthecomicrobium sp. N25 TaxID=3129254 RepID=UPI0030782ADE